ncbi:hypothetical protein RP20_CCG019491 [Aedes albopictus]|nr:hypothetical protein RP20_CCG019491 [Aedes albopictus]
MVPQLLIITLINILLTLKPISSIPLPSGVVNYSLFVIEYLASLQPGIFKCVFFDISTGGPLDQQFEEILTSPRLDHITKYTINASFTMSWDSPLPQWPSLVLINVRAVNIAPYRKTLGKMADILNPHTRLMIMFDERCFKSTFELTDLFFYQVDFTRTLIIETKSQSIVHTGFKGSFLDLTDFIHPRYLFKNLLLDMEGRPFKYSSENGLTKVDQQWMDGTAQYLNATGLFLETPCQSVDRKCYLKHLMSNDVDLSLLVLNRDDLKPKFYRTLFDVVPWISVIVVPRPRSVNVWEMFVWPFTMEAWIFLAVVLIAIEVIYLKLPNIFKNDPILLVLCGFERYNLHHASTREKLIFLALIVYFFLMLNAYETRIISFMTNKPLIGELRTLRDLATFGIKLKLDKYTHLSLQNDSLLRGITFDDSDERRVRFDRVSAYYGAKRDMERNMQMPYNYDFGKRRTFYYMIEETIGMNIGTYIMISRSGLLELFYHTERVFFEAGLLHKWETDEHLRYFAAFLGSTRPRKHAPGLCPRKSGKTSLD